MDVLKELYQVILQRREQPQEGSYTCYLFEMGLDKILKKVGEESSEVIIAAKNGETKHKIEVEVKDMANNAGDDKIDAFTLSATFLTMFFHNTVALIVSGAVLAGLVALAIALIVKKRKSAK